MSIKCRDSFIFLSLSLPIAYVAFVTLLVCDQMNGERWGLFITFNITKFELDRISDFAAEINNNHRKKCVLNERNVTIECVCVRAYANITMTHIQIVIWLMISLGIVCWRRRSSSRSYLHTQLNAYVVYMYFKQKTLIQLWVELKIESKISGVNFVFWSKISANEKMRIVRLVGACENRKNHI